MPDTPSPKPRPARRAGAAVPPRTPLGERLEHLLSRWLGGQSVLVLVMAMVLGVAAGYGAILFRAVIDGINTLAFPGGFNLEALAASPWWAVLLPPVVGGMVVVPIVTHVAVETRGAGVAEVIDACDNRGGRIRRRVTLVKMLASGISIGSGGSVGREGPIAHISSSIGSAVGQFFGLEGERLKVLVATGAAAGIAATFNAPIAGVLFAVEIILRRGSARTFSPLVVGAVVATVVSRLHLGDSPAFHVGHYNLVSPWELPLYAVLGLLSALIGVAFIRGIFAVGDLWAELKLPTVLRGGLGGLAVGLIALIFPQVMGVGYHHIDQMLNFDASLVQLHSLWGVLQLLLLAGLKIVATGCTLGTGGSGGIFAPSLVVGSCLGSAFGIVVNLVMPAGMVAGPAAYSLVCMGAVVAATTHAPLTAIIVVFELTDRHTIILPLMFSCIIATVLCMWMHRESIYSSILVRRGTRLSHHHESAIMAGTTVSELVEPVERTLDLGTPLTEVVQRVVDHGRAVQYVVDGSHALRGVVMMEDVAAIMKDEETLAPLLLAADIMRRPPGKVRRSDTLEHAMSLLAQRQAQELPVVDDGGRLIGHLTRADVIALYNREIIRHDAVVRFVEGSDGDAQVSEQLHLPPDFVREEIVVGGNLLGRTLRQLNLRARFGVSVYAVRDETGKARVPNPGHPLVDGEVLEVFGPRDEVAQVRSRTLKKTIKIK